jgi:hypothetical protein
MVQSFVLKIRHLKLVRYQFHCYVMRQGSMPFERR